RSAGIAAISRELPSSVGSLHHRIRAQYIHAIAGAGRGTGTRVVWPRRRGSGDVGIARSDEGTGQLARSPVGTRTNVAVDHGRGQRCGARDETRLRLPPWIVEDS